MAIIISFLGGIAAGYVFHSAALGLLAGALVIGSLADYLLPLRFTLTPETIEVRGWLHRRRMAWSQVRRVRRDPDGVYLSPLPRHSRLDAYRGIYIWFEGNAEEVMRFIANHVPTEAAGGGDFPPV